MSNVTAAAVTAAVASTVDDPTVLALAPLSGGVLAYIAVLVALYLIFLLGVSIWSWNQHRGKEVDVDEV
jgi:hypothetical protein